MSGNRYRAIEVFLKGDDQTGKTAFIESFALQTYYRGSRNTGGKSWYSRECYINGKAILAKIYERPGCDLFLMSNEKPVKISNEHNLYLYKDDKGIYYKIQDEDKKEYLDATTREALKNESFVQPALNPGKCTKMEVCSAVFAETSKRNHTWPIAPDVVYLIYDVTNEKSFQQIQNYYDEIIRKAEDQNKKVVIILIGNKADDLVEQQAESKKTFPRKITAAQGKELADKLKIPFYEVSSKENMGAVKAFEFGLDQASINLEVGTSAKALLAIKTRESISYNPGEPPGDQPTLGVLVQSPK